jgi:hypothetical protein
MCLDNKEVQMCAINIKISCTELEVDILCWISKATNESVKWEMYTTGKMHAINKQLCRYRRNYQNVLRPKRKLAL